jgi:hypothetical protein
LKKFWIGLGIILSVALFTYAATFTPSTSLRGLLVDANGTPYAIGTAGAAGTFNPSNSALVQLVDTNGNPYTAGGGSGTVTSVATGTGLTGGPITTTGTVSLADTKVTPGSYTTANITVDQQGRLTAASSGSGGGLVLIQVQSLSGDAATITFSGLNGDTDGVYLLEFRIDTTNATSGVFVRPNGATTNLSDSRFFPGGSDTSASEWELYHNSGNAATLTGWMVVYASKSIQSVAHPRYSNFGLIQDQSGIVPVTGAGKWNESSTNMTSLVIFTNQATGIKAGSYAALYKYAQS